MKHITCSMTTVLLATAILLAGCGEKQGHLDSSIKPDATGPRADGGRPDIHATDVARLSDRAKQDAPRIDAVKPDKAKADQGSSCPAKNPLNADYYVFEGTYKGWCLFTDPDGDVFSAYCPASNQALYSADTVDLKDQVDKQGLCT
jgi:hypothetical protein